LVPCWGSICMQEKGGGATGKSRASTPSGLRQMSPAKVRSQHRDSTPTNGRMGRQSSVPQDSGHSLAAPLLVTAPRFPKATGHANQRYTAQRFSRALPHSRGKVVDSDSDAEDDEEVFGAVSSAPINLWRSRIASASHQGHPDSPALLQKQDGQDSHSETSTTCGSPSRSPLIAASYHVWGGGGGAAESYGTSSASLEGHGASSIHWLDSSRENGGNDTTLGLLRLSEVSGKRASGARCRELPHCMLDRSDTAEVDSARSSDRRSFGGRAVNESEQVDMEQESPVARPIDDGVFSRPRRQAPMVARHDDEDDPETPSPLPKSLQRFLQDSGPLEHGTSSAPCGATYSLPSGEGLQSSLAGKRRSSSSGCVRRRRSRHVQFLLESNLQRRDAISGSAAAELAQRLAELPAVAKARAAAAAAEAAAASAAATAPRTGLALSQAGSQCISAAPSTSTPVAAAARGAGGHGTVSASTWSFRNGPPPWSLEKGSSSRAKSTGAVVGSH